MAAPSYASTAPEAEQADTPTTSPRAAEGSAPEVATRPAQGRRRHAPRRAGVSIRLSPCGTTLGRSNLRCCLCQASRTAPPTIQASRPHLASPSSFLAPRRCAASPPCWQGDYIRRTAMPCTSARSVRVGEPPTVPQVNGELGFVMGATATSLPLSPPSWIEITPIPGVAPTALLVAGELAVSGQGPRSDANAYLPSGAMSMRSGAGSVLILPARPNSPIELSVVVSTTSIVLADRSAAHR